MKTLITLVFTILFSTLCVAQNGINYKAVIKNNLGNVIANDLISVQFTILKGVSQTNVYRETHTPTTDANGLIIINIGEGTPISGTFATINWANDDHFLNVQINTGAGLVNMGTTEFKTVPYAKNAETATVAANVTGLEALNESNGIGWRLIGRDPNKYGNIGSNAVDLSYSVSVSTTKGATGIYSTAIGTETEASGDYSTAIGNILTASGDFAFAIGSYNEASGSYSTSMGADTEASGYASIAMGTYTNASGDYSTAMGEWTTAPSVNSLSTGKYNVGLGNATLWVETDPLFEIGNGTSSNAKSNALTVLKNGTITAPSFDLAEITSPKALITKEYADANLGAKGLEAINEGNGIGWRLKGRDPNNYGNIGENAVDLSSNSEVSTTRGATGSHSTAMGFRTVASKSVSTAMGNYTIASGSHSTAMGYFTTASQQNATAMGESTTASGVVSTAIGNHTTASGTISTAMGNFTTASGYSSTAMGLFTTAASYNSLAIGRYNVGGGNANLWVDADPLFEVGFGTSSTNKLNAITVLKNGYTAVGSHTVAPSADFHVFHGLGTLNGFKLQNTGSNENWWRFYTINGNGLLYLYSKAGGDTNAVGSFNNVSGAYSALSDRRVKENFNDLHFNWQDFMKLEPLNYTYKTDKNKQSQIGFIAQDVMTIYPELVNYNNEDDLYQLNYSGFGVVAVKAVQELKNEVKSLSEENMQLKTLISNQKEVLRMLIERVEALETNK